MSLHGWELFIVFALVVLFFGAKRLPEMGEALGKSITSFKSGIAPHTNTAEASDAADERLIPVPALAAGTADVVLVENDPVDAHLTTVR